MGADVASGYPSAATEVRFLRGSAGIGRVVPEDVTGSLRPASAMIKQKLHCRTSNRAGSIVRTKTKRYYNAIEVNLSMILDQKFT